jgi:ABC-type branched-subunit amino acid transport system ATPase component
MGVPVAERDVERALDACSRGYLLLEGPIATSGPTAGLRETAEVRQRVLGR